MPKQLQSDTFMMASHFSGKEEPLSTQEHPTITIFGNSTHSTDTITQLTKIEHHPLQVLKRPQTFTHEQLQDIS